MLRISADESRMSTSGVLVRRIVGQFFTEWGANGEQNSPLGHRVIDFALLWGPLKLILKMRFHMLAALAQTYIYLSKDQLTSFDCASTVTEAYEQNYVVFTSILCTDT